MTRARGVPRDVWRERLQLSDAELLAFCDRWSIVEFAVFGSILREDWGPDSDIDVLVTFAEGVHWPWGGLASVESELERLLGRPVDVGTRRSVEEVTNPDRRSEILGDAQVVAAA
ncbi:MAG TPA: nucleotidyltransferase domain-containing protein [Tepidiformaceae bacterium]|nr:nucleotidyltransferase domain-containing protein [Tepidiformaceae bacterium]